jgi:hypothetical protein
MPCNGIAVAFQVYTVQPDRKSHLGRDDYTPRRGRRPLFTCGRRERNVRVSGSDFACIGRTDRANLLLRLLLLFRLLFQSAARFQPAVLFLFLTRLTAVS